MVSGLVAKTYENSGSLDESSGKEFAELHATSYDYYHTTFGW